MLNWRALLVDEVQAVVQGDPFWESYLTPLVSQRSIPFALHLAILVEPYLQFILDGHKTVESRFSARRRAPYESVRRGDVVLLKRSGGPLVGIAQIANVWFYRLDPKSWKAIRAEFTAALCAQDPAFWKQRRHASFATLMRLQHVRPITPIACGKRDRRGWVILQSPSDQLPLREITKPIVLAFAGRIASGKSTLSKNVARGLNWPYISFGNYVRQVARSQGLDCSRQVLQDIGAALIDQGWEGFCRAVLSQVNWEPGEPLVIDGICHVEAVDTLRQLVAPSKLLLVFVDISELEHEARLRQSGLTKDEKLERVETHSTEAQVRAMLPGIADLTVDGNQPIERLLHQIMTWVKQHTVVVATGCSEDLMGKANRDTATTQ